MNLLALKRLVLLAVLFAACLAAPASAAPLLHGKIIMGCSHSHTLNDDPLVFPGQPGASHQHAFSGNVTTDAYSTLGSLLDGPTNCFARDNHSAYWTPTIITPDGTSWHPRARFYYGAGAMDPDKIAGGRIQPFPTGLGFITGNSHSTVYQSALVVKWRCSKSPSVSVKPPVCAVDGSQGGLQMEFNTPNCWDGRNLTVPDGKSHMAYKVDRGCPASHPVALPQMNPIEFQFPVELNKHLAGDWRLSSDAPGAPKGASAHFDYLSAWGPEQAEFTECLNDPRRDYPSAPLCEALTYDGSDNGLFADSRAFPWARRLAVAP